MQDQLVALSREVQATVFLVTHSIEEAVYVGDRIYEDVWGPQQIGMRAIWIPHSDLPPRQRVTVDATPDATVHELREILGVVTGWTA